MNSGAADLHGSDGIQDPNGTLKRLEIRILVREHAESALVDAKTNTGMNVLFCGLEPSITGSLQSKQ